MDKACFYLLAAIYYLIASAVETTNTANGWVAITSLALAAYKYMRVVAVENN